MPASPAARAAELLAAMPFAATLGITLQEGNSHKVRVTVSWAQDRCTAGGFLHGGVLMAVADTAGAICAFLNLPQGRSTATVESKTNFFRAVRTGTVLASAHPIHAGKSFIVVQTDLTDGEGRHISQTTQTQAVLDLHPTAVAESPWSVR